MICIITGPVGGGKTTTLEEAVELLRAPDFRVAGYLSRRVVREGATHGYDLFDLEGRKATAFLRTDGEAHWDRVGDYRVDPLGLAEALKVIDRGGCADLLVIDEVGPLELKGRGLWPFLEPVLTRKKDLCLVVVREHLHEAFKARLPGHEILVCHVRDGASHLAQSIKKIHAARGKREPR